MPTIFSHPAVPLVVAAVAGRARVTAPLLAAGIVASMLPDGDVVGFRLGIPYGHELGHRGFTHSLAFAAAMAALACAIAPWLQAKRLTALWFVGLACASHGLLDMLTNGGRGIALLWPFTDERLFWPARVIEVSPINPRRFAEGRGLEVIASELLWIWLPAMIVAGIALIVRRTMTSERSRAQSSG